VSDEASVFELVFRGTRDGRAFGVVAAAVVTFDPRGRARSVRVYVDVPTLVGQIDPSRFPDLHVRAPQDAPPAGAAVAVAAHTATEARNFAAAAAVWARLDAHDPAGVLAASADDYVYDDFSGPAPLDRPATERLVERFLAVVPDFAIAEKPTFFAAGDDVVTESIEHMTAGGHTVILHGLDVKRFANGQIVREWQYANGAEVQEELLGRKVGLP
jgi:hypothetical protein